MPRFAANISTMFGEWDFPDRIRAAADAGFSAVECQWPYEFDAEKLAQALSRNSTPMVLINAPAGDVSSGDRGLAAMPGRQAECRDGIEQALRYCQELGCFQVHLLSGCPPAGQSADDCRSVLIENARYAADLFAPHNVQVLLEPINTHDLPGYFLNRVSEVVLIIEEIERANIGLQFDVYHAYRMGDDPYEALLKYQNKIDHIQISGFPGRHEPDVGEIDYPPLFEAIDVMGYAGWVGCEYIPQTTTAEGLGWFSR